MFCGLLVFLKICNLYISYICKFLGRFIDIFSFLDEDRYEGKVEY